MPTDRDLTVSQSLIEHCFIHFYGLDISNASMHVASVRFSPITFRLQEVLDGDDPPVSDDVPYGEAHDERVRLIEGLMHVRHHSDEYEEDKGR